MASSLIDQSGTTEMREEGFYWVILGKNPPEIAYRERGEWWLSGNPRDFAAGVLVPTARCR